MIFLTTLQGESFCTTCIPLELLPLLGDHYKHNVQDSDLLFLGRQNLYYLEKWWAEFVVKCSASSYRETTIYEALKEAKRKIDSVGSFDSGLDEQCFEKVFSRAEKASESLCEQIKHAVDRRNFLKNLAPRAEEKPLIFETIQFHSGEHVKVFVADSSMEFGEEPQFVYGRINHVSNFFESGVVDDVKDDWLCVRLDDVIYDGNTSAKDIEISINSLGLLKSADYDYFCRNPDYYKLFLNSRFDPEPGVLEAIRVLLCATKKRLPTTIPV